LLGRSSQSNSAEKRRRQDTDDDDDVEDDEDGDDGYDDEESDASLPRKKPRLEDQHDVREAVKVEDIQDLERIKAHLNDALLFINKLGIARRKLSPP
jgi:hypothetical protein